MSMKVSILKEDMKLLAGRNLSLQSDVVVDDSDKTFIVPAGKQWWLKSIYVVLITTGTVGNRQVDVLFTTAADVPIAKAVAGAVQAASLTRSYCFAVGNPQDVAFVAGLMYRAIPDKLILPAGYKIRVYDSAAIAPAADDMTVQMLVDVF